MQSTIYKLSELFLIFIIVPVSFAIAFPIWIKMVVGIFGFFYVLFVLLRIEKNKFKITPHLNWKSFFKRTCIQLVIIALLTILYMWFVDKSNLYVVVLNKPFLWLGILFGYSFFFGISSRTNL